MDPVTAVVVIGLFIGYLVSEAPYTLRGQTSPRQHRKNLRTEAWAAGTGTASPTSRPPASPTPLRDAARDWWGDACADATELRRRRRDARRARRAGDPPPPVVGLGGEARPAGGGQPEDGQPGSGQATTTGGRRTYTDVTGYAPLRLGKIPVKMPEVPKENLALFDQYLFALMDMGQADAWSARMQAMSDEQRRDYWQRIAAMTPTELADDLNQRLAEARATAQQQRQGTAAAPAGSDQQPAGGAAAGDAQAATSGAEPAQQPRTPGQEYEDRKERERAAARAHEIAMAQARAEVMKAEAALKAAENDPKHAAEVATLKARLAAAQEVRDAQVRAAQDRAARIAAEARAAAAEAAAHAPQATTTNTSGPAGPGERPDTGTAPAPAGTTPTQSGSTQEGNMTTPNAEAINTQSAVEFAGGMADQATAGVASLETFQAQLMAGEVEGQALALTATAIDLMTQLGATFGELKTVLESHLVVGEAYAATGNEAGNKDFAQIG